MSLALAIIIGANLAAAGDRYPVWTAFREKLDNVRHLDERNDELKRRVADLEIEVAHLENEYVSCREEKRAEKIKTEAKEEGGIESARTIASLDMPDESVLALPPREIFDKAIEAFNAGDHETAAKSLSFLVENSENDAFQRPRAFFLAGVSLFKVGDFKKAEGYLKKAESLATGAEAAYAPRALAWQSLCRSRLGDKAGERKKIRELIEKYPKSKEARRLNRNA